MGHAWGFGRHGGPEVQEFFDRPDPVPGRCEVLIQVDVAGVNPLDHLLRSGLVDGLDGGRPFPRVLGMEAAGTVLARGEDVTGLEVGDAVFGFALTGGGTYAETTVLSAPNTARIPAGLSTTVAATLPVAGTTAVDVLDQLNLTPGATILVNGVGGGVGLAVARLAVARELRVIGTGSTAKREHAEAIGVRFVDYTAENVAAAARAMVPDGFDGIVDLAGGTSLRTVAPLAQAPRDVIAVGDVSVSDLGGRFVERRTDRESLERSARLALDGLLAPVITAVHPLSGAPAALATVENGHTAGKVVIKVT
ncbi:NADP-dependent oxidoreductase [Streptomyces albidoflavus]|uniref:NADP-dependent oxidoreductase n=1 Tax=Streptomyces albidoflavus TaxID=1886 RepID=UPI001782658A